MKKWAPMPIWKNSDGHGSYFFSLLTQLLKSIEKQSSAVNGHGIQGNDSTNTYIFKTSINISWPGNYPLSNYRKFVLLLEQTMNLF